MRNNRRVSPRPTFTPACDAWPDAGVYQLWIGLRRPVRVCVGRLGVIHFAKGTYVYTGRAARGLRARAQRHVRGGDRLHWHIDYLLAQRTAQIERVILASRNPEDECRVNGAAADEARVAVRGFGASDCRSGCPGHLWWGGWLDGGHRPIAVAQPWLIEHQASGTLSVSSAASRS